MSFQSFNIYCIILYGSLEVALVISLQLQNKLHHWFGVVDWLKIFQICTSHLNLGLCFDPVCPNSYCGVTFLFPHQAYRNCFMSPMVCGQPVKPRTMICFKRQWYYSLCASQLFLSSIWGVFLQSQILVFLTDLNNK